MFLESIRIKRYPAKQGAKKLLNTLKQKRVSSTKTKNRRLLHS